MPRLKVYRVYREGNGYDSIGRGNDNFTLIKKKERKITIMMEISEGGGGQFLSWLRNTIS